MANRFPRLLMPIAALGMLVFGASAQPPLPLPGANPVHDLTLTVDESGQIGVASYGAATTREPLVSEPVTRYAEAIQTGQTRDLDLISVQLLDAGGAVVYQNTVTVARWVRGEFALDPADLSVTDATGSNIEGVHLPWRNRTFNVKVPVITGANRLAVSMLSETRSSTIIDLSAAAAQLVTRSARDVTLIPLAGYNGGNPDNRIDLVILGDGYTAAQQADFAADAQALADGLFALSPYSDYKPYFNVVAVFGASNESGADQPVCTDPDPPMNGLMKDTRYDSTYCYADIARLLVATDYTAIFDDSNAGYPDWDEIIVIVNDFTYGGSGGAIAAVSKTGSAAQILQHEIGHSIIRLDDEYSTLTPGYPPCSDILRDGITAKCQPNVTDQTTRALIKWSRWIHPATPVPTFSDLGPSAGLWEGAHYQPNIYYRPCFNCTMRSLGQEFGAVASEQLPVVLYQGGWEGQNSYWTDLGSGTGIDIIEPGTVTPDPLTPITMPLLASKTFSASVLSPLTGNGENTRVRWAVDGTLVHEEHYANLDAADFTFTPTSPGSYLITAEAIDAGGILHSTQTIVSKSTRTWTVTVEGFTGVGTEMIVNGGFEMPSASNSKQPESWKVVSADKSKRKCDTPPAHEGSCAYLMKGIGGITAKLKQTLAGLGDGGDAFHLSGHFDTLNLTAEFSVWAKVILTNGEKRKIELHGLPRDQAKTAPYAVQEASLVLALDEADVAKVKLQMKFPDTGGKVYIDALSLLHYDEHLTSPPPPG